MFATGGHVIATMSKHRPLFFVVAAALAGVGVFAAIKATSEREPEYGGKKLSEWVGGYLHGNASQPTPEERDQAMRGMGTNAVPYLVKWIRYDTPLWKTRLCGLINPALKRLHASWELNDEQKQARGDLAVFALTRIPREAGGEIAELLKLRTDPGASRNVQMRVESLRALVEPGYWKDGRVLRLWRDPR